MRFTYTGDLTPGNSVSFGPREESEIQEDMTFTVEDDDTATRLAGMESPPFQPIVDDDTPYRVLQKVASNRDDVSGNLPETELRAALTGEPMESESDEAEDATSDGGA